MPFEAIAHPDGGEQESFLVETRSLSGYSGSPVFTYEPFPRVEHVDAVQHRGSIRVKRREKHRANLWNIRLLGIDWANMPIYEPVYERVKNSDDLVETEFLVKSNSGQMAVVPAWKLSELLFSDALREMRDEVEREYEQKKSDSEFILDFHEPGQGATLPPKFENALLRARRLLAHKGSL
jgi:hypothetical protein